MELSQLRLIRVSQSFLFHAFFILCMNLFCFALQRNETDRLSLLAIKDGISSSDPNGVCSSWNNSLHFCKWSGVICSKRHPQRVVALKLLGQSLVGTLSPQIANLSFLRELDLSDNNFQGHIPCEIDRLVRLRYLNLSINSFDGEIPNNLTHCLELIVVELRRNKLIGRIPSGIGSLSKLNVLDVGFNNFTGDIPPSLGNLSSLTLLYLSFNNLEGSIPSNLGQLGNLQRLAMGENRLSGLVPNSIYNLSLISVLDLGVNHFHGRLTPELGLIFPNLEELYVPNNRFTGPIPVSLGNASRIKILQFTLNNFSGSVPMNFGRLHSLQKLGVSHNELGVGKEGDLNFITSLTNCSDLKDLRLNSNLFGDLVLDENSLTGSLPMEVGQLQNLEKLVISNNKFSGEIPNTLGSCIKMENLYMHNNFFQGSIPPSLSTLKVIVELDLSRNNLSGQIPKYLDQLAALKYLNLSFNGLEGEVPTLGIFKNASTFSIEGNKKLCGGILKLQLPRCPKLVSNERGRAPSLRVIMPVVVAVTLSLVLFSCFITTRYSKKRSRKEPESANLIKDQFLEVTYAELLNATNGFSPANLIGAGSFGFVYKGILDRIHTTVAVKVLKLQLQRASKSFMAECKALRSIQHRNIVKVLTVCSSIDFKGDFGLARILSKDETNYSQPRSSSLLVKGSIGYIAPEYGMGGDISIYGDVYSYGILLLEMFTGKRPTDDMFEERISLHEFAKMMVAERKMEILDERLLLEEDESNGVNGNNSNIRSRRQKCLVSMMKIGISCSVELPKERMEMKNVVKEIHGVRNLYLGVDKAVGEHNETLLSAEGPSYLSHY